MLSQTFVQVFPEGAALSQFAADWFAQTTREALTARGRCLVSLSGGGTPTDLYRLLAQVSLPWEQMLFFWGDERCVAPTDPESCYHQAHAAWLGQVPIPAENIFRVKGELGPEAAAADYARQLKSVSASVFSVSKSAAPSAPAWPRFDLALLGLGADGHTASLFPGSPETRGLATVAVTANYQDRPAQRVSLTPEVLNSARNVVFLVTGAEKAQALATTLTGARELVKFPAQRICPTDGIVWWLVDAAAASLLPEKIEGVTIQR
jgi:6-phosphogluconolactonase